MQIRYLVDYCSSNKLGSEELVLDVGRVPNLDDTFEYLGVKQKAVDHLEDSLGIKGPAVSSLKALDTHDVIHTVKPNAPVKLRFEVVLTYLNKVKTVRVESAFERMPDLGDELERLGTKYLLRTAVANRLSIRTDDVKVVTFEIVPKKGSCILQ